MPATYAAVTASLNALVEIRPDFAPKSLLDIGAGPGTATWAAAEAFPSLQEFTLLDANDALRTLALDLVSDSFRLRDVSYERGEARAALAKADAADLVVASYMIGEIGDAEQRALAELMWEKTRDTLLVVEPGTPAGYARIIALRERLIALGAHVAAPCPHDGKCPLQPPDWCHFTQRLQRSRAHKQVKGAELPFEDERFAYVALTRATVARVPRVLAQPPSARSKLSEALHAGRLRPSKRPRRAKADYAAAKRWRWGDAQMCAAAARLVPFHPAPAALARAQAGQGRGAAVRGRKIRLCRADARGGCTAPCARAGATGRQQGRNNGEALHAGRPRPHKGASPRQGGLRRRPALALGRCGELNPSFRDGP